jgi:D-alanyl-D-alanine carboxypeptidase
MRIGNNWRRRGLSLVFTGVFAVGLPAGQAVARTTKHHTHTLRPAPAAPDTGFGPTAPGVSSILIDATSGAVISSAGADVPRYPASLTKLMTLDLAFQALRDGRMTLDTQLPVSYHAASVEPVKLGLRPGSSISARDAILAMTTMSANDAATAMGEFLGGGSEQRCAQMMTLRAHALGMAQTQFANASGLPDPAQVTTARDLSILARDIVVNFPQDQYFFQAQQYLYGNRTVYSNNQMLKTYPGASGMKTGYTILARHNLVTSAERNGKVLIGVVLHEPSWGQTYQLMTAMLNTGYGVAPGGTDMMVAAAQPRAAAPAAAKPPAAGVSTVASRQKTPAAPITLASKAPAGHSAQGWTAQVGIYSHMTKARTAALAVRQLRGVGIPRIAKVQSHGKTMWSAQLAGLTQTAAHKTCNVLAAKGTSCMIIPPQADHMASRENSDG